MNDQLCETQKERYGAESTKTRPVNSALEESRAVLELDAAFGSLRVFESQSCRRFVAGPTSAAHPAVIRRGRRTRHPCDLRASRRPRGTRACTSDPSRR